MVIQGSACVYSKKVEYLYALTAQTLELILTDKKRFYLNSKIFFSKIFFLFFKISKLENKKRKENSSIDKDGKDRDVEEEEEPEFLDLNIKEAVGIDLVEGEEKNALNNALLISQRTIQPLRLNEESNENGDKRGDFRMNTCAVNQWGALILEPGRLSDKFFLNEIEKNAQNKENQSPSLKGSLDPNKDLNPLARGDKDKEGGGVIAPEDSSSDEEGEEKEKKNADEEGKKAFNKAVSNNDSSDDEKEVPVKIVRQKKGKEGSKRKSIGGRRDTLRIDENIWLQLDPHDAGDSKLEKPFKKGKSYRIPKKITIKEAPISVLPQVSNSIKKPYFVEFQYFFDKLVKARQKEKRKKGLNQEQNLLDEEEILVANGNNPQSESIFDANEEEEFESLPMAVNYEVNEF